MDKACQGAVRWDFPLNMSKCQRLMEEENPSCHMAPPRYQFSLEQMQQARDLRVVVGADVKRCRKVIRKAWRASRQLRRNKESRGPNFYRCSRYLSDFT